MNNTRDFDTPENQRLLDQLVDGELSEQQRRTLLESLDTTPDGWRRCALTFIEAQELQRVLPALATEDVSVSQDKVRVRAASRSRTTTFPFGSLLAMAASVLVAFTLGLVARGTWPSSSGASTSQVVDATPSVEAQGGDVQVVEKPWEPLTPAKQDTPSSEPTGNEPAKAKAPEDRVPVWSNVALAMNDAEGEPPVEWLMAEGEAIDLQWLYRQPSALSEDVIQQIEQLGHEVNVVRELFPVRLQDGRQGIVPVDHVELRYVGNSTYQ